VVIIGGGIMGVGLAYNLCRRGITDVVLLERAYVNAGASGRNGGGVRAQWTTPTMIRLARRSLEIGEHFASEMGINVWFRRGGYLFLAPTREHVDRIEKNAVLHARHGVRTRILTPAEALEVVPQLDPTRFLAASWNPDDAVVFPWPFAWGYASRAEALGAKVVTFTRVTGFESTGKKVTAVVTDRGRIACETVVNACGAWSREVAALAGVKLPNEPERHEILVTEPQKPWLQPLVSVLGSGLYFSQSGRGEIVGGLGDPDEPSGLDTRSTLRFLARFSRAITAAAPITAGLQVMRQWAGCYDVTPRQQPHPRGRRLRQLPPALRLRGPRLHDGPGGHRAHGRLDGRRSARRDLPALHARPLRPRRRQGRGLHHRLVPDPPPQSSRLRRSGSDCPPGGFALQSRPATRPATEERT
jgi:sarcosine oxidase subunit beta